MKVTVVIPTYNESENIDALTERVLGQGSDVHVLIVDDGSPDGTGTTADRLAATDDRIEVLHRAHKMGLGSAYRDGFNHALRTGADYIVAMDADFSHDPDMLPVFLESMNGYDVVVGSRYLLGASIIDWPLRRLLLSYSASVYTRLITGMVLSDCTSGFKCFRRDVLETVGVDRIRSEGYSFQIEMSFRCLELGLVIGEVPITFVDRHAGSSKMSARIVAEAAVMVWKLRVGVLARRFTSSRRPRPARMLLDSYRDACGAKVGGGTMGHDADRDGGGQRKGFTAVVGDRARRAGPVAGPPPTRDSHPAGVRARESSPVLYRTPWRTL